MFMCRVVVRDEATEPPRVIHAQLADSAVNVYEDTIRLWMLLMHPSVTVCEVGRPVFHNYDPGFWIITENGDAITRRT